ncbi:MAG TPA: hypothetical protein VKE93_21800 [Candidatus Angelobacter sp.]|nr:hypothetical protein [Candidatus Angelobacter sp.]
MTARLAMIAKPRGVRQRLSFAFFHAFLGQVPGPVLALSYRRDFCGKYLARCYQQGLRRAQEWSVGEVELFAAFVSTLNRCHF